jgi:hypothetical protein
MEKEKANEVRNSKIERHIRYKETHQLRNRTMNKE